MHLHMTSKQFNLLCTIMDGDLGKEDTQFRPSLKGDKHIALSLHTLAGGLCFGHGGQSWNRGKSTMHDCFYQFLAPVEARLKPLVLKFPKGAEAVRLAQAFEGEFGIPNVIGVLDGSHIPIKRPRERKEQFFNRKLFFSFNNQGIVSADQLCIDLSPGYPGSIHDTHLFYLSRAC